MAPSTVHEQEHDYDERNNFLYFMLGLVSVSRRLQHLVDELPPAAEEEAAADDDHAAHSGAVDSTADPTADTAHDRDLLL